MRVRGRIPSANVDNLRAAWEILLNEVSEILLRNEKKASATADAASLEKRRHARFPFTASVEALEPISNAQINGRTSDISLSGCYVDTISPFPEGTSIRVRLTRENVSFEANAKVMFSQIGMGMGIAFTSAEKRQFQIFQKWIDELNGILTSPPNELETQQAMTESVRRPEDQIYILNNLIVALMRKGVLDEIEGKTMLKRLHE
jgi:hypothetical protein